MRKNPGRKHLRHLMNKRIAEERRLKRKEFRAKGLRLVKFGQM